MLRNHLIQRLPTAQRQALLSRLAPVAMSAGDALAEQDMPMRALLFPLSGSLSLQRGADGHSPLQLAMVGRESCVGALLLLGPARHPLSVEVLAGGPALVLEGRALPSSLAEFPALRLLLAEVLRTQHQQLAQAGVCCRFHALEPRLARWLLEMTDRNDGLRVDATQWVMARVLGVRREAVTSAASALQDKGVLQYHRGHLEVRDRLRLIACSCSCYREPNAQRRTVRRS